MTITTAPAPDIGADICYHCRTHRGYGGVDAHGRAVCPLCWCPHCHGGHTLPAWRDACAGVYESHDSDPETDDPDRVHDAMTGR